VESVAIVARVGLAMLILSHMFIMVAVSRTLKTS